MTTEDRCRKLLKDKTELIDLLEKKLATIEAQRVALTERCQKLTSALDALLDEQNGPPLERYAADWRAAVDRACVLLGRQPYPHEQPRAVAS